MLTQHQMRLTGMPLQIGFHSIGGDPDLCGDPLIPQSQPSQGIDIIDFFVCHIRILSLCREELTPPGCGD